MTGSVSDTLRYASHETGAIREGLNVLRNRPDDATVRRVHRMCRGLEDDGLSAEPVEEDGCEQWAGGETDGAAETVLVYRPRQWCPADP